MIRRPSRITTATPVAGWSRVAAIALLGFSLAANGQDTEEAYGASDESAVGQAPLSLPFAFWNEHFGVAAGFAYSRVGHPQPQAGWVATVMAGTAGSLMATAIGRDFRLPWTERWFVDPAASFGYWGDSDAYVDGNPKFPDERAGSNQSSPHNFISGHGTEYATKLGFKYLLPIGDGRERINPQYDIEDGLLVGGGAGGHSANPLRSGRTYIRIQPFVRSQEVNGDGVGSLTLDTNGLEFGVLWDNRDYSPSPMRGNAVDVRLTRDFGAFNSDNSWTAVQLELDGYHDLGATKSFRQRVLALDFWTSYSPSWDVRDDSTIDNRPPPFAGGTLGGLWRMRAYPAQRFSDRAAIYYAAELRLIPQWNPFDNWQRLQRAVGVQWIQIVPFVEVGRVAPSWDAANLHSSMKWDAGIGLRAWAKGVVVRVDVAASEEGMGVQMMVGQPFLF